jgi:hypothetical protein
MGDRVSVDSSAGRKPDLRCLRRHQLHAAICLVRRQKCWPNDGDKYKHPGQEAAEAQQRLNEKAQSAFDEFQILRFRATNAKPFPFQWVDLSMTEMEYSSVLTRVSRGYDRRFQ